MYRMSLVMGIEPTNKSSVSVRFSQGQGSCSVQFDWSFSRFGLVQFDSTETVVRVQFGSVLVYQSHKITLQYTCILHLVL